MLNNVTQETEQPTDEEETESEIQNTQSSLVSEAYNSEESDDSKKTDVQVNNSNVMKLDANSGSVLQTNSSSQCKNDSEQKKSNRETMSYLKSKRIIRHKTNDTFETKKQRLE